MYFPQNLELLSLSLELTIEDLELLSLFLELTVELFIHPFLASIK